MRQENTNSSVNAPVTNEPANVSENGQKGEDAGATASPQSGQPADANQERSGGDGDPKRDTAQGKLVAVNKIDGCAMAIPPGSSPSNGSGSLTASVSKERDDLGFLGPSESIQFNVESPLESADVEGLRLDTSVEDWGKGDEEDYSTIEICSAHKILEPVRTHPDPSFWGKYAILEHKGETYILHPSVFKLIREEPAIKTCFLVPTVSLSGKLFVWPVAYASAFTRNGGCLRTRRRAAEEAREVWTRVIFITGSFVYKGKPFPELADRKPQFPKLGYKEIIQTASEGLIIRNGEHPVLKELGSTREAF